VLRAIAWAAVAALVLRLVLVVVERGLRRVHVPHPHPGVRWAAAAALLAVVVVLGAAAAPQVRAQYDEFVAGDSVARGASERERLTQAGNNGRLDQWRVALDSFRGQRWAGTGAGTYALTWARERPDDDSSVADAHSLYLEVLAELGLLGALPLFAALLLGAGALVYRARGPTRAPAAGGLALVVVWALHAAVDWDWELPALTLGTFALMGVALGRAVPDAPRRGRLGWPPRVVVGAVCLGVALPGAALALAQPRLDDAARAFERGDCEATTRAALASLEHFDARPEPFEYLAWCDVRTNEARLAPALFRRAIARDPGSWRLHYGLAVALAVRGLDPRDAVRATVARNPRGQLVRELAEALGGKDADTWPRAARQLRVPLG